MKRFVTLSLFRPSSGLRIRPSRWWSTFPYGLFVMICVCLSQVTCMYGYSVIDRTPEYRVWKVITHTGIHKLTKGVVFQVSPPEPEEKASIVSKNGGYTVCSNKLDKDSNRVVLQKVGMSYPE